MQPLATDVRTMRRLRVDGTAEGEPGDAVARYRDEGERTLYFFPGPQTRTENDVGISVDASTYTVKAPYCREFRPGDRLADRCDGTPLYEVVSVTDYPGHQRMEVRPI